MTKRNAQYQPGPIFSDVVHGGFRVLGLSGRKFAAMHDVPFQNILAAGERLRANDVVALRSAERPITLKDLQDLARVGDDEQRSHACRQIATGAAKNVKAALAAPKPKRDATEAALEGLMGHWARAPKEARRRFARHYAEDLMAFIEGADG